MDRRRSVKSERDSSRSRSTESGRQIASTEEDSMSNTDDSDESMTGSYSSTRSTSSHGTLDKTTASDATSTQTPRRSPRIQVARRLFATPPTTPIRQRRQSSSSSATPPPSLRATPKRARTDGRKVVKPDKDERKSMLFVRKEPSTAGLPKNAFKSMVRELTVKVAGKEMRFANNSFEALREAVEDEAVRMFFKLGMLATLGGRKTVLIRDLASWRICNDK